MANIYDINGNVIQPDVTFETKEPNYNDIPVIGFSFTGNLPKTKEDGELITRVFYKSQTLGFDCYASIKVQGSSSVSYPKKNYTIKLFKDYGLKSKNKVAFKDWEERNKFVLKANWIDHSHSRNIVNARLWTQIVKSRSDFNSLPSGMRENHLAVDGFPVKVYFNGVYHGIYTMNLPKDVLYGLDDKIETNTLMESGGMVVAQNSARLFRASNDISGVWTDETHDEKPSVIATAWDRVLNFVYTSTDSMFVSDFNNYIDKQSVIDQYIFLYLACIVDNIGKNQFFATYDAQKWYGAMYDMDGTWGNPCYLPRKDTWFDYNTPFQTGYTIYNGENPQSNLLYERVENLFSSEIIARYTELRNGVLSEANILAEFDKFTKTIPPYLYAEDYAETTAGGAYINIPLKDTNNILQIREFVNARCAYVDSVILA